MPEAQSVADLQRERKGWRQFVSVPDTWAGKYDSGGELSKSHLHDALPAILRFVESRPGGQPCCTSGNAGCLPQVTVDKPIDKLMAVAASTILTSAARRI